MIVLYRKGSTHIEFGIQCEAARFEPEYLEDMLAEGWVIDPKLLVGLPDDKDALELIAREYGVELDKRKTLANLQKQVQELIDGKQG